MKDRPAPSLPASHVVPRRKLAKQLLLAGITAVFGGKIDRRVRKVLALQPQIAPIQFDTTYGAWLSQYDRLSPLDFAALDQALDTASHQPLISVIMPTCDTKVSELRAAMRSVIDQRYKNWELCIADDASSDKAVLALIRKYARSDSRFKVVERSVRGGIAAASNAALELATGEWIALLDHDDLLPAHALALVALEISAHPDAVMIYSDEDAIDESGRRFDPYFKCDWNLELLLGQNFVNHLCAYRTEIVRSIEGFRSDFDGSQDWDLALRVGGRAERQKVRHIPHILYHWRKPTVGATFSQLNIARSRDAGLRAVQDFLRSQNIDAVASPGRHSSWVNVRRNVPSPEPLVTVIIPTRDRVDLLEPCVDGVLNKTEYRNLEVLIINNGSVEPTTLTYLDRIARDDRVKVIPFVEQFNYSRIHNEAFDSARGEVSVLLNNDIEVIRPDWLACMVGQAMRPDVGAVGAMLVWPNNIIQHAGVILGIGGVAGHAHMGSKRGASGYFGRACLTQELSAVTGACLATRTSVYRQVHGMNEALRVSFNDIDYCLRLRKAGYLVIWTPLAELVHHESATRGKILPGPAQHEFDSEIKLMQKTWLSELANDPYYNPNLTLSDHDFSIAFPSRARWPFET